MRFRDLARALYPLIVGAILVILLFLASSKHEAIAGSIRKAELSPERPLVVRLAIGRSTALSFPVRPEKVVPGNPQGVEINFLGRDLTLRPLSVRPGNLIVYTKSTRYVVLLNLVSESAYDDSVVINGLSSYSRPVRLTEDAFRVESFKISPLPKGTKTEITATTRNFGKVVESDSLPPTIRCKDCVTKRINNLTQLICTRQVVSVQCRNHIEQMRIDRITDGD